MLIKEFFHRAIEIELVFLIVEPMPFILFDHVLDRNPSFLQRGHDLVRLVDVDSRVVCSLGHE